MTDVRLARETDLVILPGIERAAGEMFRLLGMDVVADDEPPTVDELSGYQQDGRLFVADDDGRVVAYLLLDVIAGAAHIEQVSVHPDAARRRIGGKLIDVAAQWARGRGLSSLTLTSYQQVPWNAPYYARLGFDIVPEAEQSPELRAVRRAEIARGLDAWPRVVMRRPVTAAGDRAP